MKAGLVWLIGIVLVCLTGLGAGHAYAQSAFERAEASHASIFMYHRFADADHPSTSTSTADLKAHIAYLKETGFTVLPLSEIVLALKAGRPLPDKTAAITIDDAYKSFAEHAWPLLRAANMPATLFVSTQALDQNYPDMVSWDDLRTMAAQGLEIGNHTVSHPHMPGLSEAALRAEISQAQARIKQETGTAPGLFAYPYGEFGAREEQIVAELGFDAAFGQQSGVAHAGEALTRLPRFPVSGSFGRLNRFTASANALPLPATDITPHNWVIGPGDANPPHFGFTIADGVERLDNLVCYTRGGEKVDPVRLGAQRFEVRAKKPLPKGRAGFNCTVQGKSSPQGVRWRWRGIQFTIIEE